MKPSRRRFLQFSLGAAGGFILTPINWKFMDDAAIWSQNWSWVPVPKDGARAYTTTSCRVCGGGCGIKVRLIDGKRAVKIEGNPLNPINRGGLCACPFFSMAHGIGHPQGAPLHVFSICPPSSGSDFWPLTSDWFIPSVPA